MRLVFVDEDGNTLLQVPKAEGAPRLGEYVTLTPWEEQPHAYKVKNVTWNYIQNGDLIGVSVLLSEPLETRFTMPVPSDRPLTVADVAEMESYLSNNNSPPYKCPKCGAGYYLIFPAGQNKATANCEKCGTTWEAWRQT